MKVFWPTALARTICLWKFPGWWKSSSWKCAISDTHRPADFPPGDFVHAVIARAVRPVAIRTLAAAGGALQKQRKQKRILRLRYAPLRMTAVMEIFKNFKKTKIMLDFLHKIL